MKTPPFARLLVFLALATRASALILIGGAEPLDDRGWPAGASSAANLPSRLFWAEGPPFGGGEWTFFNAGDTAALQLCVDAFTAIVATNHEIRLHPGHPSIPYAARSAAGEPIAYDWCWTVWQADRFLQLLGPQGAPFMSGHPDFGATAPPLRLDVWVHAGGPDWDAIRVPTGTRVADGRAEKHGHRADRMSLQVRFVPAAEGPVEHARIELIADDTESTRGGPGPAAKAVGDVATVADIPPGRYRVVASAPGFVARVVGETTVEGDTFSEFSVALDPVSSADGIVRDRDDQPVADVVVRAGDVIGSDGRGYPMPEVPKTTTGADGRFTIRGLPAGRVQLRAHKPGLYQLPDSRPAIPLPASDLMIRMVPTGSVRAQVGAGGAAHIQEAARRGVGSWGGAGNADPEGWVEFQDVPVGEYFVSPKPFADGALAGTKITVEPGRAAEIRVAK